MLYDAQEAASGRQDLQVCACKEHDPANQDDDMMGIGESKNIKSL